MQYEDFISRIQERTDLDEDGGLRAVQATFTTLNDRLTGGAASNLGSELPDEVKHFLAEEARGEVFGITEFRSRLGARMDTDPETATERAAAVLDVVREAVDQAVVDRVADQLPPDYRELFDPQELSPATDR